MSTNKNHYCVIMAGGVGARFWPMSKTSRPKQFIDILGIGKTLLQMTFDRFTSICPPQNIYIVTNEIYREQVMEQLPAITGTQVLCEPARRNTAPCIAYANHVILQHNPDAIIVVAPSDHIILKEDVFTKNVLDAIKVAQTHNWLITLGIEPSRPDTGYGYIQYLEGSILPELPKIKKVKTFTEKPSLDIAISFLESGDFLWNAGIFIWSLRSINKAFERYLPEVNDLFMEGSGKYSTELEADFIKMTYSVCRNISIDYGVMEKADNVHVMSVDFGWSDLGTWGSLYEIRPKDQHQNTIVGNDVMTYDTYGCVVNMPKNKLVVLQGLKDYIVVEDDNALLVCRKQDEQQIRKFVNDIKVEKGENYV
ncbi:MAG: mannose-1-phosphate guanylyltransferase [Bacteroidetes bacterium HGW-Bacteroidetes-1]|jgi:mannose-1-phosphate guanylyltransferase|nr:MAG: mannose-1-phosphate guanylyltransferase [Bacteroidetes bacterium HGW-Bacteroidetes-1]